jgi:hypothetical protein
MAMIAPDSSKPAFSKTDQGNDSENAAFVFVKASEFYPMSSNSGFLEFKNFSKDWFFPGIQAERASRLPAKYLPSQASRPRFNSEVRHGTSPRFFLTFIFMPRGSRILEGCNVGQASRLTSSGLQSQASRPRYIPEAQKRSDFWHQNLRGEKAGRREEFITQRKGQARKPERPRNTTDGNPMN